MAIMVEKFRLYPDKCCERKLRNNLGVCREVHNTLLGLHKESGFCSRPEFNSLIRDIKATLPKRYYSVHSQVLQDVGDRLNKAFSNFFRRVKENKKKSGNKSKPGFPRFKSNVKSLTYPQSGFSILFGKGRHQTLCLSKIGNVRIRCHRKFRGRVKRLIIKRYPSGKWYAFFCVKIGDRPETVKIKKENVVGIDVGIEYVTYDSKGMFVENPGFLNKHEKKQKALARKHSGKKKGSRNKEKARVKLARQYEKVTNAREDFVHKLSAYYVNNYDAVGVEDFRITQMVRNNRLAKHILNSCWGKFRRMLQYKAENAGKSVISVESRGTTQRCSQCGEKVPKELWDRQHTCPYCGLDIPRDYNSALEVKRRTLKKIFGLGQDMPEVTPVEMKPLPFPFLGTGQASSMKQEPCAKCALPS